MCGINGIIGNRNQIDLKDRIIRMNRALTHRGPDAQGIVCENGYAVGHTRLSILDLSTHGNQPMFSLDKRYILTYNGEVFNFEKLRKKVQGYPFKSKTDTEVILALFEKYGIEFIQDLEGMFAIAIYDTLENETLLLRDRLGQKPLYYSIVDGTLVFSSELRGILASKLVRPVLNKKMVKNYTSSKTVFSPNTIIEDIYSLQQGSYAIFKNAELKIVEYWRPEKTLSKSLSGPYWRVQETTKKLFFEAVEKRLVSDVPMGAFLSGGIDSSCIVAAMSKVSSSAPKTVHISFDENEFNESKYASLIAKKYKTDHTEIRLKPEDFLKSLPDALKAMDHPSNDGCNSYIISKKTKDIGLTVALSGVGGDELFGGYPVFTIADKMLNSVVLSNAPKELRRWTLNTMALFAPGSKSDKLKTLAEANMDPFGIYKAFRSSNTDGFDFFDNCGLKFDSIYSMSHISILEMRHYMSNILLRDMDQMSMANQLEVRAPFLDHALVEYIISLPNEYKPLKPVKKLLIDSMGDLLPDEIWDRKKMGFVFPWKYWVNHELYDFCLENLTWLEDHNILDSSEIAPWKESLELKSNPQGYDLWNLVVLAYWLRVNEILI
jgi:asparagine synthase (glutamine-hydrolysing)